MSKKVERSRKMQPCKVTIATTADNQTTEITLKGHCSFLDGGAKLRYQDEGATVALCLEKGEVFIQRIGDYTLRLHLKKDEVTNGVLGINGAEGEVKVKTTRIAYSISKSSLLLSLHYLLIIGSETQKMKLRIFAKTNE